MGKSLKKQEEERNNALLESKNVQNAATDDTAKEKVIASSGTIVAYLSTAESRAIEEQDQDARDLEEDELKRQLDADDFEQTADLLHEIAIENESLQKTVKDLHEEAEMLANERNEWRERAEAQEKERQELAGQIAELSREIAGIKAKDGQPAQMEVIKPRQTEKVRQKPASAADVISNANNLIKIGMRIDYLKEKKAQMDSFIFGSSQTGESMTMKDAGGQEFTSSNPVLLKKIKDMVCADIKHAIEQAELQLFDLA
jgi:archaellum component FlaC